MGSSELRLTWPDPQDEFYQETLAVLDKSQVPYLIGGSLALTCFTGIMREMKDLDLFVLPKDFSRVIDVFSRNGFDTKIRFSHWLGKVFKGERFVDIIFSSGNGLCSVDEVWFEHADVAEILGFSVKLVPPEEMIWSKAFVMERDRFDGADVTHLLHACGKNLDWARLLRRFDSHWRVLFSHVILFGFIYPAERAKIPHWVQEEFLRRYRHEINSVPPEECVCQGTLLSWSQYLSNVEQLGYADGRHRPHGNLTAEETARLTTTFKRGE
jgi:hypothetical protein